MKNKKGFLRRLQIRLEYIVFKRLFSLWQKLGFHLTKNHYYEPIPDTRTLRADFWTKNSEFVGVNFNEQKQIDLLSLFSSKYKKEYDAFPKTSSATPYEYFLNNGGFESVDAEISYCMIRHFKPKKIIEIGSGSSTYLAAKAVLKNKEEGGFETELVAIEPYPNSVMKLGFPGLSELIPKEVQEVPFKKFQELKENDILFIDSSHVLKIGNDVQYEYLKILPRINRGVIIHIHDIFLPEEYPRKWVMEYCRFYTEQYLLQAILAFSDQFEVLWGGNYMNLKHPDKLESAISSYKRGKVQPGSFWIRKIK